jgi:hypothetical protein
LTYRVNAYIIENVKSLLNRGAASAHAKNQESFSRRLSPFFFDNSAVENALKNAKTFKNSSDVKLKKKSNQIFNSKKIKGGRVLWK